MKIRHVLPTAVVALAVLLLGTSGTSLREAVTERGTAEAFLEVNRTAELLLDVAGAWAIERGMTNGSLNAADPVTTQRRDEIAKQRTSADAPYQAAVARLRAAGAAAT